MQNPGPNRSAAQWQKSSYSGGADPDSCVEVARNLPGVIPVRDSKDPEGPALVFPTPSWSAFLAEVRAGGFPA
jgi:hypothetical protein